MSAGPLDDLGALRGWAASAQPVFICGQERSGTSALQLALARHPALFPVPHVFETFVFNEPRALLADPPRRMLQGYLGGPEGLAAMRERLAVLGGGDAAAVADEDLIRAFFAHAASCAYPGRRPLEKTPSHVYSLPRVFALFPQARVLACVREPVEVVDSYRRRLRREQALGKAPGDWAWLDKTDQQLIAQFRRVDQALREAAVRAPGQVFQVPYAWLTADPAAALAALCDFIGEPFDPALLAPRPGRSVRIDERLGQPLGAPPTPEPTTLTEAVAATLRRETWGLSRRWRVAGPLHPDTHAEAPAPAR
ncbi:sulfotransferase [Ideonella sp.]|uniref:sulfotransferase family protein n=1 Tax=Ideonella sp. TaxID=1929293 RepID=UPI002B4634EC|nr:sulfotransferase [Ideonella sp.]HJV69686.1 sulfotransferase [Ideonella sp.]